MQKKNNNNSSSQIILEKELEQQESFTNQNLLKEYGEKRINLPFNNKNLFENHKEIIINSNNQSISSPTKSFSWKNKLVIKPQKITSNKPDQLIINLKFQEGLIRQLSYSKENYSQNNNSNNNSQLLNGNQIISKVISFSKKKSTPQFSSKPPYEGFLNSNILLSNECDVKSSNTQNNNTNHINGNLPHFLHSKQTNFFHIPQNPQSPTLIYKRKKSSSRIIALYNNNSSDFNNTNTNNDNKQNIKHENENSKVKKDSIECEDKNRSLQINISDNNIMKEYKQKVNQSINMNVSIATSKQKNENKIILNKGIAKKNYIINDKPKGTKEKIKNNINPINCNSVGLHSQTKQKKNEETQKRKKEEEKNKLNDNNDDYYKYSQKAPQLKKTQSDNNGNKLLHKTLTLQESVSQLTANTEPYSNDKGKLEEKDIFIQDRDINLGYTDSFFKPKNDIILERKKKLYVTDTPSYNNDTENKIIKNPIDNTKCDNTSYSNQYSYINQPHFNYEDSYFNFNTNANLTTIEKEVIIPNRSESVNNDKILESYSNREKIKINEKEKQFSYNKYNSDIQNLKLINISQDKPINPITTAELAFQKFKNKKKFDPTPIIQIDLTNVNNNHKDEKIKPQVIDKDYYINIKRPKSNQEYQKSLYNMRIKPSLTQVNREKSSSKEKKYQLIYDYDKIAKEIELDKNTQGIRPKSHVEHQSTHLSKLLATINNYSQQNKEENIYEQSVEKTSYDTSPTLKKFKRQIYIDESNNNYNNKF